MQVVRFDHYGPPDVLYVAECAVPPAPRDGVRIRNKAIGVNPADVKWRQGMFKDIVPISFPHVLGYDIAGVVDAVGAGVAGVSPGDRVMVMLDPMIKGGYAEYTVVPASDIVHLPATLDFDAAAALPTPALTGFQLIDEYLKPSAGDTILLTGAVGAVGRCAMFAARRRGASVVAAVRTDQVAEALSLGAARTIVLGSSEWSGAPFDGVADTIGGPAVGALCRNLRPGGLVVTVATTPIEGAGPTAAPRFIAVHQAKDDLARIGGLVADRKLTMPIAQRLSLADAAVAHRLVEAGRNGGRIILLV